MSYSESEDDLILEDTIKYIYQNYSLCEEGCTYNSIDLEYLTISCDCKVKSNMTTVISPLNLNEIIESPSGYDIIKCYNLVFSKDGKLTNYGFWIFTILLGLHIPLLIIYSYYGISPLFAFILDQMVKYGYLKKQNPKSNNTIEADKGASNILFLKEGKKIKNHNQNNPFKRKKQNNEEKNNINENNKENNNELIEHSLVDNKKSFERELDEIKEENSQNKICYESKEKSTEKINIINDKKINNTKTIKKVKKGKNKKGKKKVHNTRIDNNSKIDFSKLAIKNNNSNNNEFQTQIFEDKNNNIKENNNLMEFNLININLNLRKNINNNPRSSNRILNNYNYEEAIEFDKRSLCGIFYIYLLSKQVIFHTFCFKSPLELLSLRFILLIFIISSDFALNAFFYFKDNISKKYVKSKNLILFSLSDNIGIIFLSTIIGFILLSLFTKLSNTKGALRKIFRNEEDKLKKDQNYKISEERKNEIKNEIESILKKFKIKIILLIIIELIFMVFFWYYVTAFCHVYQRTQISWILDSLISLLFRVIIDLLLCLGLAKLYRLSVNVNIKCLYNICLFLYDFD